MYNVLLSRDACVPGACAGAAPRTSASLRKRHESPRLACSWSGNTQIQTSRYVVPRTCPPPISPPHRHKVFLLTLSDRSSIPPLLRSPARSEILARSARLVFFVRSLRPYTRRVFGTTGFGSIVRRYAIFFIHVGFTIKN